MAYEEEEGGEDTYDQHHHGGNEMGMASITEAVGHEYTNSSAAKTNGIGGHHPYEEEEKGDNAGSLRAPKSAALMQGEDHGSSGKNKQHLMTSGKLGGSGGNLQATSGLIGSNGGVSL